jgi:hypothetical protein
MHTVAGPPGPRYKFSLLGTDWVEWLLIGVISGVSAVGVAALGGSIIAAVLTAILIVGVAAVVIALL